MSLDVDVLTDLATVKDELGITGTGQDSTLERYISQASQLFRSTTGRNFHFMQGYVERVAGRRRKRLMVGDHLPIDAINSIKIDTGTTVDTIASNDYEIEDADRGYIQRISGSWQSTDSFIWSIEPRPLNEDLKLYKVDYDGGYVTPEQASQTGKTRDLPHDIEQAIISQVTKQYQEQGQNPNIVGESVMSASIDYADPTDSDSALPPGTTPAFANVVQKYKSPETMFA